MKKRFRGGEALIFSSILPLSKPLLIKKQSGDTKDWKNNDFKA